MIEFQQVTKVFGGSTVVQPLDLEIAAGEVLVLLGPSGCGKTTILRMVAGLETPSQGQVIVDQQPVNSANIANIRRKLGYVIQEGGLFPHLTGRQNLALAPRHAGWSAALVNERLAELMELAKFPADALNRYPNELSGGQRQRLSLMRALFLRPKILLLDEPLGALDPLIRASLQRDLQQLFVHSGATVLLVTHDLVEASRFANRVCLLNAGRIVQQGSFAEILANPRDGFAREFIQSQVVAA